MKLGSLKSGGRDGILVVVSHDLRTAVAVPEIASTLQAALDDWEACRPALASVYQLLNEGCMPGAFGLDPQALGPPLPRAYQWLDASAYLSHVARVRRARGANLPPHATTDPLMYQGGSDGFLGPYDPIVAESQDWGIDFEAEVAVITDDVPMGVDPAEAGGHIVLLILVNDVSLRHLIPPELAKGFGFLHGKPASALSPVAVTPDELGAAWDGSRVHLPLRVQVNGVFFGAPEAGQDMTFDFPALIAHAARTRHLGAGTLIGSGTVSNADASRGFCCIAEKRAQELIETGAAATPYLRFGDRVRIEMLDAEGRSIFGAIDQEVQPYHRGRGSR
ncbi:fumarylacetoacetate hydrolase family protein [Pelomicrobium sp.]|uniref:fumarylacetoacetate hydrolase family protein n=1 Tax=Pelomicrobium sp. TaxID=2815319 RepID=UPI002FDE381B